MEYKINGEVLKATLNYLSSRPYAEVFNLVRAIQSSEEIKEEKISKKK